MGSDEPKITLERLLWIVIHEAYHRDYLRKDNPQKICSISYDKPYKISQENIDKAIDKTIKKLKLKQIKVSYDEPYKISQEDIDKAFKMLKQIKD